MKLNYDGIIFVPNKLKFDYGNTFKKLLIKEQILVCRHVNFFEFVAMNIEILCSFGIRLDVTNTLVTGNNIICQKCIYLQKNESSLFKHNVDVFCKSLKITLYLVPCAIEAKLILIEHFVSLVDSV